MHVLGLKGNEALGPTWDHALGPTMDHVSGTHMGPSWTQLKTESQPNPVVLVAPSKLRAQ